MPKKKTRYMPDYTPTEEQQKHHDYCMRRDIRISPGGTHKDNCWTIDVYANGKWNKSPNSYGPDEVWEVFYNYCKYYYDKK